MNKALLIGNLASDPSTKVSESGTTVCTFRIGVNSGWGENKQTSWLHIVCFGKTAENCDRYLAKGRKVAVEGRIVTGSYENKEGRKVYTTDIYADNVEFLGGKEDAPKKEETVEDVAEEMSGFAALDEDEIPFK